MIKLSTPLTNIDSTPKFTAGTRTMTKDGNEYIYLPGVASVAQYDWVLWSTASAHSYGSVTRMVLAKTGLVGIAQAAIVEGKHGWFQTSGIGWAKAGAGAISSGSTLYACGTTATADAAVTAGAQILNSLTLGTSAAGGTVLVYIDRPFINGVVT